MILTTYTIMTWTSYTINELEFILQLWVPDEGRSEMFVDKACGRRLL